MADSQPSEQQIIAAFKQMRADQQTMASKIAEMELEANEHSLVLGALEKLEAGRRCYRMVGGVLVERTVGEVTPAVAKNREGIQELVKILREQLQKKSEEISQFVTKYNIQVRGQAQEDRGAGQDEERKSSGVLV